jgi:predicted protein tyrosine phosphatase
LGIESFLFGCPGLADSTLTAPMGVPRLLFVCGKNLRRSPTAARIYRDDPRVDVRSAGVSDKSQRRIQSADLEWADLVLVMERKHKARILAVFGPPFPPIECLDIPDDFEWMDEELVDLILHGTPIHVWNHLGILLDPG